MNYKSSKFILFIILVAFLFRGIFLVAVFPIFKGQDESRHYNTVQYLATKKKRNCQNKSYDEEGKEIFVTLKQDKKDLSTYRYSDEIREAAKFTQHKKIRGTYYDKINFTNSVSGYGEVDFKNKQLSRAQHFCPPDIAHSALGKGGFSLYQWSVANIENKLSSQNIFVRYDVIRIFSVLLGMTMLWLAYSIFRTVRFSEKQSLILVAIISFQPKLAIYFTNINYDVLLIPLWTGFILVSAVILKKGWNVARAFSLLIFLASAIITKPSALPLLGLGAFLIGNTFYKKIKKQRSSLVMAGVLILVLGYAGYLLLDKVGLTSLFSEKYINSLGEYLNTSLSRIDGSSSNYWGAIRWSANNLTLVYVKIIWVIEWIAWMGLGLWIVGPWITRFTKNFAKVQPLQSYKGWPFAKLPVGLKKQKKYFWFILASIVVLQIGIRVADWKVFTSEGGLALGTPGRYWLPSIAPHFVLLAMGLKASTSFFRSKRARVKYFEFSLLAFLVVMVLYWSYEVFDIIIPRFYL